MADDIEAPFTIATGSTLFALLFLVLLLLLLLRARRASACACGGVSKRERNGYYYSRDIKRDTSHKNQVQSLGYHKKEKEEEDLTKGPHYCGVRSKMHTRE